MNEEDFEELAISIQQAGEIKKGQREPGRVFEFSPNSNHSQQPLTFTPVTADYIRQFAHWQYEPPYDIYNENPAEMEAIIEYYLDPQFQCQAMVDEAGEMVGLCSFGEDGQVPGGDYSREALDIGLAIRPDLTGQGRGSAIIEAVLDFGRGQYHPPAFRVTIAEFNERAQRVWQKAGFEEVQRFGRESDGLPFIIFVLPANLS